MIKQLRNWFSKFSAGFQLAIAFAVYWIIWLIAALAKPAIMGTQKTPFLDCLLSAGWMGLLMTLCFEWKKIKTIFKKSAVQTDK